MIKVPAWSTTTSAFAFVWRERKRFLLLAFAPILITYFVDALYIWLLLSDALMGAAVDKKSMVLSLASWGAGLVSVFMWVLFSVTWHRRYLISGEDSTIGHALMWRMRQTRFLIRAFAMTLIAVGLWVGGGMGLSVVGSILVDVGTESTDSLARLLIYTVDFSLFIVLVLAVARLSVWLPAAAVEDPVKLAVVWQMTQCNAWQLTAIYLLVTISFSLVGVLLQFMFLPAFLGIGFATIFQEGDSNGIGLKLAFFAFLPIIAYSYWCVAVSVTALSIAYRHLTGANTAGEAVDITV